MRKLAAITGVLAISVTVLLAQTATPALIVNGTSVSTAVIQQQGRYYVALDALARALGGSVALQPSQIVLSLPALQVGQDSSEALSKEFQRTSVAALADMREWQGAVETLITSGFPVAGSWPEQYRDRVARDIMQASVAASTEGDRNALQLLRAHASELRQWVNTVITERKDLDGSRITDPNALQNDPVLATIIQCGRFLGSMIVRGAFTDEPSCH
jgi:hypothetical protein